jgi:transposase
VDEIPAGQELAPIHFIGLDIHKEYAVAAAVDDRQRVVLSPRRVPLKELRTWTSKHARSTDVIALEAMFNTWAVHDELAPLVGAVIVANPARVARMKDSKVKTDGGDALFLARLLAADMMEPPVWVPPQTVRELRDLVNHRQRLITQRTRSYNHLRALLLRHGIEPPSGKLFSAVKRTWWDTLALSATERLWMHHEFALLDAIESLLAEVKAELHRLSQTEPWADQVAFLVQLPGIQVLNAMVLLAAIGDIRRFASPRRLVGYAGLGAGIHDSARPIALGTSPSVAGANSAPP